MGFAIIPSDHYIRPGRITAADINRAFDDINNRLGGSNYVLPLLVADANVIYFARISSWGPESVTVHLRDVTPYAESPVSETGTLKVYPHIPAGSCIKDTSSWELSIEGMVIGSGTFDGVVHTLSGVSFYGKTITINFNFDFDSDVAFLDVREKILFNFQIAAEALTSAADKPFSYYTIVGRAEALPVFASSYPHVLIKFDSRVIEADATGSALVSGTVYFSWGSDTTSPHWAISRIIDGSEIELSSGSDAISSKDFSFTVSLDGDRNKEIILKVVLGNSTFPNVMFTDKAWVIADVAEALPVIEQVPACVIMPPLWDSIYTIGSDEYAYTYILTTASTHWVGIDDNKRALKLTLQNGSYEIQKNDGTWDTLDNAISVKAIAHARNTSGAEELFIYDYTWDEYIHAGDGTIPSDYVLTYVEFLIQLAKDYNYSYIRSDGGTYTYLESPIEFLYTIGSYDTTYTVVGTRTHITHVHYYPLLSSFTAFFDPTNLSLASGGAVTTLRSILLNLPLQEADLVRYGLISSTSAPTEKVEYKLSVEAIGVASGITIEVYDDADSNWHSIVGIPYEITLGNIEGLPSYHTIPVRVTGSKASTITCNIEIIATYHDASGSTASVLIERRHLNLGTYLSGAGASYATSLLLPRSNFVVYVGGYSNATGPYLTKPEADELYFDDSNHLYYLGFIAREPLKLMYGGVSHEILGGESRVGGVTLEELATWMVTFRLDTDIILSGTKYAELYASYDKTAQKIMISSDFPASGIPIGLLVMEKLSDQAYPSLRFVPYVHTYVYEATRGLEIGRFGLIDKIGLTSPVIIATTHFENAADLANLLRHMEIGDSCMLIGENDGRSESMRFPYIAGIKKLAEDKMKLTMLTDVGMATVLLESASKYVYPVLDVFRIYYVDASGSLSTSPPPPTGVYHSVTPSPTLIPMSSFGDDAKIFENIGGHLVMLVEPYFYWDKTLFPDPGVDIVAVRQVGAAHYEGGYVFVEHRVELTDNHGNVHIIVVPARILLVGSMYHALGGWGAPSDPFTPIS